MSAVSMKEGRYMCKLQPAGAMLVCVDAAGIFVPLSALLQTVVSMSAGGRGFMRIMHDGLVADVLKPVKRVIPGMLGGRQAVVCMRMTNVGVKLVTGEY